MFSIPNTVWQFERPRPRSSVRWNDRNDALCMKTMANADNPKSATAILPPRPLRGSGSAAQTAFRPDRSDAKFFIPGVNHVSADLRIRKIHFWPTFKLRFRRASFKKERFS